jgi:hypothetical protein
MKYTGYDILKNETNPFLWITKEKQKGRSEMVYTGWTGGEIFICRDPNMKQIK